MSNAGRHASQLTARLAGNTKPLPDHSPTDSLPTASSSLTYRDSHSLGNSQTHDPQHDPTFEAKAARHIRISALIDPQAEILQKAPRDASLLPPSAAIQSTQQQPRKMATSVITKQAESSSSNGKAQTSLSGPFDIFIYGDRPDTPPPTRQISRNTTQLRDSPRALHAASTALPEHLIALPPLSSPTGSPLGHPSTPLHTTLTTSKDADPSSAERLAYRSWREGKAVLGGRVMYGNDSDIGGDNNGEFIDKKIEATLPRAEQVKNPRSRKTTHHMRVFNQDNETASDRTKTVKGSVAISKSDTQQPQVVSRSKSDQLTADESSAESSKKAVEEAVKEAVLPDQENEVQTVQDRKIGPVRSSSVSTVSDDHIVQGSSRPEVDGEGEQPTSSLDDEEIDSEHISSAVYYPHRTLDGRAAGVRAESLNVEESPLTSQKDKRVQSVRANEAANLDRRRQSEDVEFSIQSEDENQYLHGDLLQTEVLRASAQADLIPFPSIKSEPPSESDFSASEVEDELEQGSATPRPGTYRVRPPPAPPQAIALKPFSHQVGGHTAVYRFSRRAVCKELNNKENKFYEAIERYHPELLQYLPRYIGVLNVTFTMTKRRRTTAGSDEKNNNAEKNSHTNGDSNHVEETRIVSHNQQIGPMPEVYFDMNRHIIPNNLFPSSRYSPPKSDIAHGSVHDNAALTSGRVDGRQLPSRPATQHHNSWGATRVNQRLREQVMREAFAPPPIRKYKRRGSQYEKAVSSSRRRPSTSEANTPSSASPTVAARDPSVPTGPVREAGLREKLLHEKLKLLKIPEHSIDTDGDLSLLARSASTTAEMTPFARLNTDDTSSDIEAPAKRSAPRAVRRRHSGSGLRRVTNDVESAGRGDLQYFEGTDLGGDDEDVVFRMDQDTDQSRNMDREGSQQSSRSGSAQYSNAPSGLTSPGPDPVVPQAHPESMLRVRDLDDVPLNPKQARLQAGQRVKEYLLLEDLTSGLSNPCTLDLKMGTRQYGIDADTKKQVSQRCKCAATTSQQFGVRVCGMQTFDITTKKFSWKDKYYGRDLKAGDGFQEALTNFFHNGVDHDAALRHIPIALKKIDALEKMVRSLPGYRFYGSSLYIIYDGGDPSSLNSGGYAASENSDATADSTTQQQQQQPEILFKIIDFANCVTAEATNIQGVACPPTRPDDVDKGYLRGLRTIKMYFRRIWMKLNHEDRGGDREGEVEGIDATKWEDDGDEDLGNAST